MRIAYIGHSYHTKTKSSAFFIDILSSLGKVTYYWDDTWNNGASPDLGKILGENQDLIVVWQTEHPVSELARRHPNVVFVPMYDGCKGLPESYWRSLKGVKVLAFCAEVHAMAMRGGLVSRYFRYFPDPSSFSPVRDWSSLRGFFWQRTGTVSWEHVAKLAGGTPFSGFTLHRAMDPGREGEFVKSSPEYLSRFNIRETDWFPDKEAFVTEVAGANVYFAPRAAEGIGMSFLEAMAMGQVVVAPDRPTMNEYVTHGLNGLLYDPDDCRPLDFSAAAKIGARARVSAIDGYARWLRDIPAVKEFLRVPASVIASGRKAAAVLGPDSGTTVPSSALHPGEPESCGGASGGRRTRGLFKKDAEGTPLVTVATVAYNARDAIGPTMRSVLSQTYPNIEYIIVDGGSSDGTVGYVAERGDMVDLWISEKDAGAYDAMNKAARLARGRWILFMNAGDAFASEQAVADALKSTPGDADFIIGHHVYVSVGGVEFLHKAANFESTWNTLVSGRLTNQWKHGVPCHQSTFARVGFFADNGFDTTFRMSADHDFMYRMRAKGARFHHCDSIVSIYVGGGMSWNNQRRCILEWERAALAHTQDGPAVRQFYRRRMDELLLSEIAKGDWLRARNLAWEYPRLAWRAFKRAYDKPCVRLWHRLTGISFKRFDFRSSAAARPHDIEGVSFSESWGAWTDGPLVMIPLGEAFSGDIEIRLRIKHVFVNCVGRSVILKAGGVTREMVLPAKAPLEIRHRFRNVDAADRLVVSIPHAGAPRDFGGNDDRRLLGLGVESLTVRFKKG